MLDHFADELLVSLADELFVSPAVVCVQASVKELCAALETQTAALRRARADRERHQKACAELRQQLTEAADQLQLPEQLPLPADQVQLLIDQRNVSGALCRRPGPSAPT